MNEELNNNITSITPPKSPPSYYLPSSPAEVFLAYSLGDNNNNLKIIEKNRENLEEKENCVVLNTVELEEIIKKEEDGEEEIDDVVAVEQQDQKYALLKRRTRLYRTLVWLQFSMTVFTCIFIMAIMVLVALILIVLQRTIDRADRYCRDNPVSQLYTKLKSAVDKIHM
ncbi:hypothetical protein Mgra_00003508 [Meloidogyne graminicola]|uniref:Uncharacterized protein n=1 Tax=Meloidogyne graminicola TaxID=189291 RepID=A0A8S9ZV35_9BILA|nr:hypothetical protein Mgra_00003508 [Meloidogyne graminicola]